MTQGSVWRVGALFVLSGWWGAPRTLKGSRQTATCEGMPSTLVLLVSPPSTLKLWPMALLYRITMTLRATVLLADQVLELAAACTLGPSLDVDTDAEMRSLIFSHFRVSGCLMVIIICAYPSNGHLGCGSKCNLFWQGRRARARGAP